MTDQKPPVLRPAFGKPSHATLFDKTERTKLDELVTEAKRTGAIRDHAYDRDQNQDRLLFKLGEYEGAPLIFLTKFMTETGVEYAYTRTDGPFISSNSIQSICGLVLEDLKSLAQDVLSTNKQIAREEQVRRRRGGFRIV